ncbi:MAG: hypothetical protein LBR49_05615, partial [Tannerella sp.]|nr:hypothetical protein [Tannerella sp.]
MENKLFSICCVFCILLVQSCSCVAPPTDNQSISEGIEIHDSFNEGDLKSDADALKAYSDSTAQAFRQTDMVRTQEYAEQGIALARRLNDLAQMAQL